VLILTGLGDPTGKAFPFAIEVNGIASKKVPVEFINWDPAGASGGASPPWAVVQLSLDVDLFQAGRNEIAIVSLASGNASDEPPFLLISDAIVAPTSLVDAALAQSEVASLDLGSVRPEFSGDPKNDDKGNEKDRNKGNDNKPKEPGKNE